jgi:hypothetical protein
MHARTLLNLLLACVAILLVLVILYQPGMESPLDTQPVTSIDATGIARIRVTRNERSPLAFAKSGTDWYLTREKPLPASNFQIHALLNILGALPDRSYPASDMDLASAGLDPPQATLLLNDTLMTIGNTEPLENKRYVRHEDTVYLLTDKYQHLINADWTNFVARKLLPDNAGLTTLQLPGLSLTMNDAGQWYSPEDPDADAPAILAQWQAAVASYVRRYDGAAGNGTITLTFSDTPEAVTLLIIEQEPELVIARPDWGIQYHFVGSMRDSLPGLPATAAQTVP